MRGFDFKSVLKQFPMSVLYFILGSAFGFASAYPIFYFNRELFVTIISFWMKRVFIGEGFFGNNPKLWFIANNLFSILLLILATVFFVTLFMRKRKRMNKYQSFEKHHPKILMYSMYTMPVGALIINGFLITFLEMYIFLVLGMEKLKETLLLLLPHGINELFALFLGTSLALSYLKILKPYILGKKWNQAKIVGKELLLSKASLFFIAMIIILIVFSGYIEGTLVNLISK